MENGPPDWEIRLCFFREFFAVSICFWVDPWSNLISNFPQGFPRDRRGSTAMVFFQQAQFLSRHRELDPGSSYSNHLFRNPAQMLAFFLPTFGFFFHTHGYLWVFSLFCCNFLFNLEQNSFMSTKRAQSFTGMHARVTQQEWFFGAPSTPSPCPAPWPTTPAGH